MSTPKKQSKRKRSEELNDDSDVEIVTEKDSTFLIVKLCQFVEEKPFLWDTSNKNYKNASSRAYAFASFEQENFMDEGAAHKLWLSIVRLYRSDRREKNSAKSGDEAGYPKEPFLYGDELAFLGKAEKSALSTSRSTSAAPPAQEEIDYMDDLIDEEEIIVEVTPPGTPSLTKKLSENSRKLLSATGKWTMEKGKVSMAGRYQPKKRKKTELDLEKIIRDGECQMESLMNILTKSETDDLSEKNLELKLKIDKTLSNIPPHFRSNATDDIFMYLSSVERKYNNPNPSLSNFPYPHSVPMMYPHYPHPPFGNVPSSHVPHPPNSQAGPSNSNAPPYNPYDPYSYLQ